MQVLRYDSRLELILFEPELHLLRQALLQIVEIYRADPDQLPEAIKQLWLSSSEILDEDDMEIWKHDLHEFRGENSKLAEELIDLLNTEGPWPAVIPLAVEKADVFLTLINDQRHYLAALHDVGEAQMNEDWESMTQSPEKLAVMNIHFLAWLMELVLLRLEGDQ